MAALFDTPFAIVRKPDESTHSSWGLEVHAPYDMDYVERYDDWIIVDDLISSGKTVTAIVEAVHKSPLISGKCVGIALYANDNSSSSHLKSWQIGRWDVPMIDVSPRD